MRLTRAEQFMADRPDTAKQRENFEDLIGRTKQLFTEMKEIENGGKPGKVGETAGRSPAKQQK